MPKGYPANGYVPVNAPSISKFWDQARDERGKRPAAPSAPRCPVRGCMFPPVAPSPMCGDHTQAALEANGMVRGESPATARIRRIVERGNAVLRGEIPPITTPDDERQGGGGWHPKRDPESAATVPYGYRGRIFRCGCCGLEFAAVRPARWCGVACRDKARRLGINGNLAEIRRDKEDGSPESEPGDLAVTAGLATATGRLYFPTLLKRVAPTAARDVPRRRTLNWRDRPVEDIRAGNQALMKARRAGAQRKAALAAARDAEREAREAVSIAELATGTGKGVSATAAPDLLEARAHLAGGVVRAGGVVALGSRAGSRQHGNRWGHRWTMPPEQIAAMRGRTAEQWKDPAIRAKMQDGLRDTRARAEIRELLLDCPGLTVTGCAERAGHDRTLVRVVRDELLARREIHSYPIRYSPAREDIRRELAAGTMLTATDLAAKYGTTTRVVREIREEITTGLRCDKSCWCRCQDGRGGADAGQRSQEEERAARKEAVRTAVAAGLPDREIARQLQCSRNYVKAIREEMARPVTVKAGLATGTAASCIEEKARRK